MEKGIEREKSLSKDKYLSEGYFSPKQWNSFCFQAGTIYKLLQRGSVLEIGAGSGFVGGVLKTIGFTVDSLDVNEHLLPTYIGDISSEDFELENKYDCVLCAEVLEHIPFEQFDICLKNISTLSRRFVILTLPNCEYNKRIEFKINNHKLFGFSLGKRKAPIASMHYWEINSEGYCKYEQVREKILQFFSIIEEGTVFENEYHYYYILSLKES